MSFLFKELKSIKFRDLINKINDVKKDKSTISILLDVFKSVRKYGCSINEYFLYKFYLLDENEKSTYVTFSINESIKNRYNSLEEVNVFNDNVVFYQVFKDYVKRDFIDLRLASFKEFKEFIMDKSKIVSKCISDESEEVISIDRDKLKNEYNVLKIYNSIMKKNEFLVSNYVLFKESYKVVSFLSGDQVYIVDSDKLVSDELKSFVSRVAKVLKSVRYVEWSIALTDQGFVLNGGSLNPRLYEKTQSISGKSNGCLVEYSKYIDIKGE